MSWKSRASVLVALLLTATLAGRRANAQDRLDARTPAQKEITRLKAEIAKLKAELAGLKREMAQEKREAYLDLMKARTARNLSQIAKASQVWLLKFGDVTSFPPSLKDLLDKKIVIDPKLFLHPLRGSKPIPGEFVSDFDSAFDRAGFKLSELQLGPGMALAWEKVPRFKGGRVVVFPDSHVEFLTQKRFKKLMKELDAVIKKHKPNE